MSTMQYWDKGGTRSRISKKVVEYESGGDMIYILIALILIVYMWKYCDVMLYEHFNPKFQYGDYISVWEPIPEDEIESLTKEVLNVEFDWQIRRTIPAKYRKDIETIFKQAIVEDSLLWPSSFGWKYTPRCHARFLDKLNEMRCL